MDKADLKISMRRVEAYLADTYGVEVSYDHDGDNAFYENAQLVEVSTRQNYRSQLHTLLHEAGHVELRLAPRGPQEFKHKFPAMKKGYHGRGRANKSHRIDVLREEVLAWERALDLAVQLDINVEEDWWIRHRRDALLAYTGWVTNPHGRN